VTITRLVKFDALTIREREAWLELRAANPSLDSPYFHPEFAEAVHESGQDVTVAVTESSSRITTLLAHHRNGKRLVPVGWPAADFQGPVMAPGTPYDPTSVLGRSGRTFDFDHLLQPAPDFARWVVGSRPSPYIDVAGGLEGYLGRASGAGRDNMGQARRHTNKAARQLGEFRFVAESTDPTLLDEVIRLKRGQYAATGARDYFDDPRHRELLHRLLPMNSPRFGGILSSVHAGDHLIAAHFGLRSDRVLHWWFPVYDPAFRHLAPGWILLRELIAAAPGLGIERIDLGRGDDEYKRRAKTGESVVSQGVVSRSAVRQTVRRARASALESVRSSSIGPSLQRIRRDLRSSLRRHRSPDHQ
jgi:CelD/BcsL family acetyltransferase involved in cellulose biosynthesis